MSQQTINVGAAPNDGTGTPLRTAFQYTNSNFTELYTALGGGNGLPGSNGQVLFNNGTAIAGDAGLTYNPATDALTVAGDLTVDTSTLKVDSANNRVGIGTASPTATLHSAGNFTVSGGSGAGTANGLHQWFNTGTNTGYISAFHSGVDNRDLVYDAKSHVWQIASGVALTLNSSGNLGLGNTPATTWASNRRVLQIGNSSIASAVTAFTGSSPSGELFFNSFINTSSQNICVNTGGVGKFDFNVSSSGGFAWNIGTGTANTAFTFTQAMTLDASGNLLVGTTSQPSGVTAARLVAKSTSADWSSVIWNSNATPYGLRIQHDTDSNGTGNEFLICYGTANIRASIRSNGGIANYSANNVSLSDARTKTDIKPLGSYWNKIKSLEIVTFKYKDQTHSDDNIGLIAQQVESVAPELVDVDGFGKTPEDGVPLKTIYTTDLYHAAIKALQEAMARIEVLESKLA